MPTLMTAETTPPKEPTCDDLADEDDEMWPGMVITAPCGCVGRSQTTTTSTLRACKRLR